MAQDTKAPLLPTDIPLLSRVEYVERLALEINRPDIEKLAALFERKEGEVRSTGGIFELCGDLQKVRAAYIRASAELEKNPEKYQQA